MSEVWIYWYVCLIDIDECATQTAQCDVDHATCENLPGTFACTCDVGYTGDGFTCTGKLFFHLLQYFFLKSKNRSVHLFYLWGGGGDGVEFFYCCFKYHNNLVDFGKGPGLQSNSPPYWLRRKVNRLKKIRMELKQHLNNILTYLVPEEIDFETTAKHCLQLCFHS